MSEQVSVSSTQDDHSKGIIDAINRVQAVIEFDLSGTILHANKNFLDTMGYSLEEIRGKHHSMFAPPGVAESAEYRAFWKKLNRGEFDSGQYKRVGKGGKEIWIQASYNPILDHQGRPIKVVKFATDVTEQKIRNADYAGQIGAISKSQAVIEFNMNGTIITANDNFLNTVGYTLDEIKGKHHSVFATPEYAESREYKEFWAKLNRGDFDSGEYKRLGKGGKEVWIQASYNPILDLNGNPFKVVKYATNITEQKLKTADYEGQIEAISKSQAVIEFNLDGTIIWANDNFLGVMGYSLGEIKGKHHSMFAEQGIKNTPEYKDFWAKLNRGEFDSGEYKRLGKGNKEIWIQASYNPIFDPNGKTYKVVKYASDITEQKMLQITVTNVLEKTSEVMKALAEGDLSKTMPDNFEGEFKVLADSVNNFISRLSDIVTKIVVLSDTISRAAEEIASGNTDLSQRTETQASSIEETASSMEEMTGTVRQNAENSNEANRLASEARQQAEKGGQVVANVVIAMDQINNSSKKIADIIGVIDEIAFQTNLLALNAAVEAARAGDQGRGFAVVAGEVRNLAQRSAGAAKEIKSLISESVTRVQEGAKLVDQSGSTLEDIVNAVKRVNDIISEISAAGQEQASGIDQVNKAIMQMDDMTQRNAALVEQAAAASESMKSDSHEMYELVKFFRVSR
ncbi:MAG: methyl-accepting chemotaxis protein [Gammaproteobacteria bacterium]|nr:methyl-accepting chemotaxis protein [Gammaproteobacteria bacterium]